MIHLTCTSPFRALDLLKLDLGIHKQLHPLKLQCLCELHPLLLQFNHLLLLRTLHPLIDLSEPRDRLRQQPEPVLNAIVIIVLPPPALRARSRCSGIRIRGRSSGRRGGGIIPPEERVVDGDGVRRPLALLLRRADSGGLGERGRDLAEGKRKGERRRGRRRGFLGGGGGAD